jgi:DNA polymerase I-like protein with 3'-5' exonuclease and polymerase domains
MSRLDAIGLFWQDIPQKKGKSFVNRVMPGIPVTGWVAPRDFPNLSGAPYLCIDTETKDPHLLTCGPGWARGDGHIVGFSVGVEGYKWYFPCRHEVRPEENLNPDHCFDWLRDTATAHGKKPILGANLLYDIGWLGEEKVSFAGSAYDVQFAEALLEERQDVNLELLGTKYLKEGKQTDLLYQWSADYYGGKPDQSQRLNIFRCPPSLVGPYAEGDVDLPARIMPLQWERLQNEGLLDLFEMETALIPLLVAMRRHGVRIDLNRAEQVRDELVIYVKEQQKQLDETVGFAVNVDANESLQKAWKNIGLPIPLHPKTEKPSFTKDTLPAVEHPIADLVLDIRKNSKVISTFIESFMLEKHCNGIVHCQFHPLRGDDSGTRSGRFSSSDPNYQQMPARDERLAPLVRSCFVPHIGHKRWRRYDYDQIEYRFLAHYAVGPGSDALREEYIRNPDTDYHVNAQTLVTQFTGVEIPRKPIKNFNFGMTYGMGKAKMVRSTLTELRKMGSSFKLSGDDLYNAYHEAVPFTKATLEHYSQLAQRVGYIKTILGRKSRFDLWEPDNRGNNGDIRLPALPYYAAISKYGKVKRAYAHKSLNRVLQGSAADMLKTAMLALWKSGVFDYTGVPSLTVHDELDFSDPCEDENDAAWAYIRHTLENAIPLRIPVKASLDLGANWGECT